MQKLSKFLFFSFIFSFLYLFSISPIKAVDAIPELLLSCTKTKPNEFHSVRPYQAAPCGEAPTARFCSNRLVIFEDFELSSRCHKTNCVNCDIKFPCQPNYQVEPHDLNITLDESEFPIMGNTEDDLSDLTKVNEYASWYLNGIIDKKENKNSTDYQTVNLSGPLRKLLPSMIQDKQRIKTINSTDVTKTFKDPDTGIAYQDADNHNQIVVDNERLRDWLGDLSFFRIGALAWDKRTPPLPWDDGTVTDPDKPKIPFKSEVLYLKAYNEWKGKSCVILPFVGLFCVDIKVPTPFGTIDVITNKYAELWQFVPLSNNSDKRGKNYLLTADGPNYVASSGTVIENAMHKSYLNAPLYFAHTQEVKELSELLNSTFQPDSFNDEGVGFPEDVEKIKKGIGPTSYVHDPTKPSTDPYDYLDCTAVNVRTNEGDNLFPGDRPGKPKDKELYVKEAEYLITEVECHEVNTKEYIPDGCVFKTGPRKGERYGCDVTKKSFRCQAEVGIEFKLGTQTPWANEIFKNTVANTGSTFRKIFPKVSENAPVNCIADIPTTTGVEYSIENDINQKPNGGTQKLAKESIPADGAPGLELTFSHIGSVYEYFLHGIQTALRPKGYGYPIANGYCTPSTTVACGELPEGLPKAQGACSIDGVSSRIGDIPESLKQIVSAAAETYKVQPGLILAVLFGEGNFNKPPYQKFEWTEENVKNWATCEPLPNCTGPQTSLVTGLALNWSGHVDRVYKDLKKVDPSKTRQSINGCNLIDEIYVLAQSLKEGAGGGVDLKGNKCYGITMSSSIPTRCDWTDSQLETAIRQYELGSYWNPTSTTANVKCPYVGGCNCATLKGSCAKGGGINAGCNNPGDSCEKVGGSSNTSHNACVFDVAKGR